MRELTVAGKSVRVRTSFRGREWYSLPADYRKAGRAMQSGNYEDALPFLTRVIESWEFEGDPQDEAAYEGLDVLAELMPLAGDVVIAVSEAAFPQAEPGG